MRRWLLPLGPLNYNIPILEYVKLTLRGSSCSLNALCGFLGFGIRSFGLDSDFGDSDFEFQERAGVSVVSHSRAGRLYHGAGPGAANIRGRWSSTYAPAAAPGFVGITWSALAWAWRRRRSGPSTIAPSRATSSENRADPILPADAPGHCRARALCR